MYQNSSHRECRRSGGLRFTFASVWLIAALVNGAAGTAVASESSGDDNNVSHFLFRYHVTITDLPPRQIADVWIPVATSGQNQTVDIRRVKLPAIHRQTTDRQFGNAMFYLKATTDAEGRIPIVVDYEVRRKKVSPASGARLTTADRKHYLQANRLVPLNGRPLDLLPGRSVIGQSRSAVRSLYDLVDQHVRYDKPPGEKWGRGDAAWVCDSRFGNCSDFHSLFISLCRSHGIPARFQIGFPVGLTGKGSVGGYHCWAQFADQDHWVSVDISEADKKPGRRDYYFGNLPPDRVMFTTGRDLKLEPRQASGPINFFVYPHVELDGQVHAKKETDFSFEVLP